MATKDDDDIDRAFIKGSRIADADKLIADKNFKAFYLYTISDPSCKEKFRYFLAVPSDKSDTTKVEIKGLEITKMKSFDYSEFYSWTDVKKVIDEKKLKLTNIFVPWHNVVNVLNVSYQYTQNKQTEKA